MDGWLDVNRVEAPASKLVLNLIKDGVGSGEEPVGECLLRRTLAIIEGYVEVGESLSRWSGDGRDLANVLVDHLGEWKEPFMADLVKGLAIVMEQKPICSVVLAASRRGDLHVDVVYEADERMCRVVCRARDRSGQGRSYERVLYDLGGEVFHPAFEFPARWVAVVGDMISISSRDREVIAEWKVDYELE
jgi:hypothetical protein